MKLALKKMGLIVFTLSLALVMLSGCGNEVKKESQEVAPSSAVDTAQESNEENVDSTQSTDGYYPVTIQTYNWAKEPVEITFEKAPERIVAIYQSSIETLLALGLEDRIIAAAYLDDPVKPEYEAAFAKIKYYDSRPTKEEIIGMNPDFITSWYSLFAEKNYGDVGFWHERGINTYMQQNSGAVVPNSLENEYEDILNMGKIFNVQDKANQIVDDMKAEIEVAKAFVDGQDKVKTVILEINKDGAFRIYGEDSIGGDIATQVGAELVADSNGTIGKEDLVGLNPDVIFSVYYGDSIKRDEAVAKIMDDASLSSLSAVQNKKVFPIVLSEVYSSGVRTLDGIQTIISGLYPELSQSGK